MEEDLSCSIPPKSVSDLLKKNIYSSVEELEKIF